MKPHDIHRSIRNLSQDRKIGDAPSIGRVARMAGRRMRKGLRRRRSRTDADFPRSARRNRVIATWSIVFALATLGVVGSAVFLWLRKSERGSAIVERQPSIIREVASRFPSPSEREALGIVKKAWEADDVATVETYFKLDGTPPAVALEALRAIRAADGAAMDFQWLGSTDRNGLLIDSVVLRSLSESGQELGHEDRIAHLTPDDSGIWKVDFHAFARTSVPDWSEVTQPDSKGGVIRVVFGRDTYFNGVFSDENTWTCHALKSSGGDTPILGYCRKGTPQHAALERIFRRSATFDVLKFSPHAILEVRRVAGAESRQFEIIRVLAEGWVMGPVPFDESR